jgi:hypothetical protein
MRGFLLFFYSTLRLFIKHYRPFLYKKALNSLDPHVDLKHQRRSTQHIHLH